MDSEILAKRFSNKRKRSMDILMMKLRIRFALNTYALSWIVTIEPTKHRQILLQIYIYIFFERTMLFVEESILFCLVDKQVWQTCSLLLMMVKELDIYHRPVNF